MERRSGFKIMKRLLLELKPLIPVMFITISLGVIGFLAAISISAFAAIGIGVLIKEVRFITFNTVAAVMLICAVLRGFLRYGEQLSGHYIAFRILAILRDKVFSKLRVLAPAKLEGKEKGDLIGLITSDIELLEVFYAHTIAPIAIAVITNTIISIVLFCLHPVLGIVGAASFIIVGFCIPYFSSKLGKQAGVNYRNDFSESNSYILESLRGLKEVIIFNNGKERIEKINEGSQKLNKSMKVIKRHEGAVRAATDITVMITILLFTLITINFFMKDELNITELLLSIVIIASSFGPVVALSNLSNNLLHTFACAERLFNLMDEEPAVTEVSGSMDVEGRIIEYENVNFSYENTDKTILNNISLKINKGDKAAVLGRSGIGKSTLIKLLMRFYDVENGSINIDNNNIKEIPTKSLRRSQVLVSQETFIFNDTIMENIKVGKRDAAYEEVVEAAKKASLHDFIEKLPNKYETNIGELGGLISSGEKQRIGLARAFINKGQVLILDEPTSNLDTLNEGQILKSIKENCNDKTIILISHRKSTSAICNRTFEIDNGSILVEV